jgi:hypothetical protein
MRWRIIHNGWDGMTDLSDVRDGFPAYSPAELVGAQYVGADDVQGDVCLRLTDGRTAWLVSTDLEVSPN